MGRRRIRKRRTNSKSMHAAEPTAKRRKQNRVSIKTGVRTRFFLLHFQYTQLYRKNERKSEKTPPTGTLSGIIMHICADATDMKRKGKFENRKTVCKTECRRSRKLGSCPASEVSKLRKTVNSFAYTLEKAHFLDYVQYASNEKRIFRRAFLTGLLRLRHGGRRDGARSGDNLRFSGIGKKQFAVHCGFHFGHNRHY